MEEAQEGGDYEEAEPVEIEDPVEESESTDDSEERRPCRGPYADRNMPTEQKLDCAVNKAEDGFGGMLVFGIICWALVACLARKGL